MSQITRIYEILDICLLLISKTNGKIKDRMLQYLSLVIDDLVVYPYEIEQAKNSISSILTLARPVIFSL